MNNNFSFIIKDLRKKNDLTQKELASLLGVTFQAVSKWENGKSIPDILILQQISEKFNVDLEYLLSGKAKEKTKNKKIYIIVIILVVLLVVLILFLVLHNHNYEFKKLNGTCNGFNVTGSITYDAKKSSIYLNATYCSDDNKLYHNISSILYENHDGNLNKISEYKYEEEKEITLKNFLENVSFVVENYTPSCKYYKDSSLYLEITALSAEEKEVIYKIPITFEDC